eukprot:GILJ01018890.1.p1 GENE.GILJ01018890.1~~GILJ01018890.1.p1  ORF type:complete len:729 (-),score=92.86 GILJ01018890.1:324-2510(-)
MGNTSSAAILTATGTNLEIPSKLICRLHLSHRCRYLEDCNNIHLCRELDLHLLPPAHLVSMLCSIDHLTPHVAIGDQAYSVTELLEGQANEEIFSNICEMHQMRVVNEYQTAMERFEAAEEEQRILSANGGPSPVIAGGTGVSNASTPGFTFVSSPPVAGALPMGAAGGGSAFQLSAGRYNLRGPGDGRGSYFTHGPPPPLPGPLRTEEDEYDDLMLDDAVRASQQVALRSDPATPQKSKLEGENHSHVDASVEEEGALSSRQSKDEYDMMSLPTVVGGSIKGAPQQPPQTSVSQASNKTAWGSFTVTTATANLTSIAGGGAGGGSATGALSPSSGVVSPPPFGSAAELSKTQSQGVSPELFGAVPQVTMAGMMLPPPGFANNNHSTQNANNSGTSPLSLSVSPFNMEGGVKAPFPSAPANSFATNGGLMGYGNVNNIVPQPQPHPVYTKVFDVKQLALDRIAAGSVPVTPMIMMVAEAALNNSTHAASPQSDLGGSYNHVQLCRGKPSPVLSVSGAQASGGRSPPPVAPTYAEASQIGNSNRSNYRGSPTAYGVPHPLNHKANEYSLPPPQSIGASSHAQRHSHHDPTLSSLHNPPAVMGGSHSHSKGGPSPIVPVGFSTSSPTSATPSVTVAHQSHDNASTVGHPQHGNFTKPRTIVSSPPPIESLLPSGAPSHVTAAASTMPKGTPTYSQVLLNGRANHHTDKNTSPHADSAMPSGAPVFCYPSK